MIDLFKKKAPDNMCITEKFKSLYKKNTKDKKIPNMQIKSPYLTCTKMINNKPSF